MTRTLAQKKETHNLLKNIAGLAVDTAALFTEIEPEYNPNANLQIALETLRLTNMEGPVWPNLCRIVAESYDIPEDLLYEVLGAIQGVRMGNYQAKDKMDEIITKLRNDYLMALAQPKKPEIEPDTDISGHRVGRLDVSYERIVEVLGEPNVDDDPDKVTYSWGYRVDGNPVAIWDYRGSRWSYFADHDVMKELFGEGNVFAEAEYA